MDWSRHTRVLGVGAAVLCVSILWAGEPPAHSLRAGADAPQACPLPHARDAVLVALSPSASREAPANDNCGDAIAIAGEVVWLPFTTVGATDDGPVPSCQGNSHKNVWFCWTAEVDGRAEVSLCDSSFDTVVAVYDGCGCSTLTEIACDDDSCFEGAQSAAAFDVAAGHSYLISIAGWNGCSGLGALNVTMVPQFWGACCVGDECIGTLQEHDCVAQGGQWHYGFECDAFVCGECPGDLLFISIDTDERPAETTWQLTYEATGEVIAAGGGYTTPGISYLYSYCLDSGVCYNFTIYDSGGDGICCGHGQGHYTLTCDNTQVGTGGEFADSETTRFGSGCDWPTGACCLSGNCVNGTTEQACSVQYGTFFLGEDCATFVCPPSLDQCPATALAGQKIPSQPYAPMLVTSDTRGGPQLGDNFDNVTGTIHGVHWWGAWLTNTSPSVVCGDADSQVIIRFYENNGTQPGPLAQEYTVTPTWVPTGIFANGVELLYFSVDLLVPPCNLTSGWISILGTGDDPNCRFWWASSDQGNGRCYRFWPMPGMSWTNLSYCLDNAYEPQYGACCDDASGVCQDGVEIAYCSGRFVAGALCENLSPPCGQPDGACCYPDATCAILPEAACADNWLGPWTTCDQCPCIVPCPAAAVLEAESCGETLNDGCHLSPAQFNPLSLGVPVCGTVWADQGSRDTDWYQIVTTESSRFTWAVEAEFDALPVIGGFVPTTPLGAPDCSTVVDLDPYATGGACEPISVTTICLPAGTYWFYVSVGGTSGLPCGSSNSYLATLTAEPCVITGACCYNDGYDCVDNQAFECAALGGQWWVYESCTTHACLTPCPEATIDIEVFTDAYPRETRWEVTDALTGDVVATEGPYEEWNHLYTRRVCVPLDRCFTFTIYDEYGNGICCNSGEGYYNVYYEGTLVRSGGRFSIEESCDVGPFCPPRAWACCVAGQCVGDLTQAECLALNGTWVADSRCADGYDCAGEVDFRLLAPLVNVTGSTCNQDDDCSLRPSEEVEYLVSLPEDGVWSFALRKSPLFYFVLSVGTTRCGEEIGVVEESGAMIGTLTARVPAGDYYVTIEGLIPTACGRYALSIAKLDECTAECPPNARAEGEPVCYDDYNDVTNGGCTNYPHVVSHLANGETVCGTSGTYLRYGTLYGDQDWYQVQLSAPATLKWNVCATFDSLVEIVRSEWGFCEGYSVVATTQGAADIPTVASAWVEAGTYWLCISPFNDPKYGYDFVPCGSPYVATLTVTPEVCMCGDLDLDTDVDYDDYLIFLMAFGGPVDGNPPQDGMCDDDGSGAVGLTDYAAWLNCYRAFIGNPLAPPPAPPTQIVPGTGAPNQKGIRQLSAAPRRR